MMLGSQTSPASPEPSKPAIAPLVREAWSANEGDMPAAASALYGRVVQDQALLGEILPQVLMTWCRERIGDHVGSIRIAAMNPPDFTQGGGRLRAVIAETAYDWLLPGGKRLGDANAAEVMAGADHFARTEADAGHKKRWLAVIAAKTGSHNSVRSALSLDEINALHEETRNA